VLFPAKDMEKVATYTPPNSVGRICETRNPIDPKANFEIRRGTRLLFDRLDRVHEFHVGVVPDLRAGGGVVVRIPRSHSEPQIAGRRRDDLRLQGRRRRV
jgi:hypothetical protein